MVQYNSTAEASTGSPNRWAIILSGGNGMRLRDLVYERRADHLPKQYLNFVGTRTMLEQTVYRATKLVLSSQLLVVIAKQHLQFAEVRRQIAPRPQGSIVVQPENKDTGPGTLLPLMHLHKRSPDALVAVFPTDHFVVEEDAFMRHVERAFRLVESDGSRVVLLGIEPTEPDPEYGYILLGDGSANGDGRTVEMFVEKPSADAARKIIDKGALWNTLVLVARCETLLQAIKRAAPDLYQAFDPIQSALGTPDEQLVIERVYQKLQPINFSKGVLDILSFKDRQNLRVLPVRGITWRDLGTQDRLAETLRRLGVRDQFMAEGVLTWAEKPARTRPGRNLAVPKQIG